MKPSKVKTLLSQHGTVTRLYLVEEGAYSLLLVVCAGLSEVIACRLSEAQATAKGWGKWVEAVRRRLGGVRKQSSGQTRRGVA
jgi:hypothetical protein